MYDVFARRCAHRVLHGLEQCSECLEAERRRAIAKAGPSLNLPSLDQLCLPETSAAAQRVPWLSDRLGPGPLYRVRGSRVWLRLWIEPEDPLHTKDIVLEPREDADTLRMQWRIERDLTTQLARSGACEGEDAPMRMAAWLAKHAPEPNPAPRDVHAGADELMHGMLSIGDTVLRNDPALPAHSQQVVCDVVGFLPGHPRPWSVRPRGGDWIGSYAAHELIRVTEREAVKAHASPDGENRTERQSGRTTRQLQAACQEALAGRSVCYVVHDHDDIFRAQKIVERIIDQLVPIGTFRERSSVGVFKLGRGHLRICERHRVAQACVRMPPGTRVVHDHRADEMAALELERRRG